MTDLLLDVRAGATAGGILGALVEVGASLEAIERAVGRLGSGPVRMSVRGGGRGTAIRVFAPEGTTTHDVWGDLRPRLALLALDDEVTSLVVSTLGRLFAARGTVHRTPPDAVEHDPISGPDEIALSVAVATALTSLDVSSVHVGPVGVGRGTLDTLGGPVTLPGPVVDAALGAHPRMVHDAVAELVDPLGAAWVAELAVRRDGRIVTEDELRHREPTGPTGRGRLPVPDCVLATLAPVRSSLV